MTMDLQSAVVAIVVPGCALYVAWLLAPAAAKRQLARGLLKLPLPRPLAATLQRTANGAGGCGCDGCDAPAKQAAQDTGVPITLHRRRP
jgi:hypothetical protein